MTAYRLLPKALLFAACAALGLTACTTIVSPDYGVREGRFPPCPANQDCVSSQEQDPKLYIEPLHYNSNRSEAHDQLVAVIDATGAARIVSNHPSYIRAEYPAAGQQQRSSTNYYQPASAVDEVEFYLPADRHVIELRSFGKLGLMESGAARERLERIRAAFEAAQQTGGS